ncbi:MAG: hypothetical protein V4760_06640 [Bdellovibrionota bacterium]
MHTTTRLVKGLLLSVILSFVAVGSVANGADSCRAVFNPAARETLRFSAIRPVSSASVQKRALDTVREIKILQYNVENLFMTVGKHERVPEGFRRVTDSEIKPAHELEGIAKPMREFDPDLMVMQEIESVDSLARFNKDYLGGKYRPLLVKGNDERGINIGFYVKQDLPLDITIESHKNTQWTDPTSGRTQNLFSRDVPAVMIRRQGEVGAPLLIVLGNHAKSKRDRDGDPLSERLRAAQYQGVGKIIDGYRAKYGKDVAIVMAGDFNTDVRTSASVKPVRDRMVDAFDVKGLQGPARVTHTYHPNGGKAEYNQIDAIFVSPSLSRSIVAAGVYRYKDASGREKPLPRTYDERGTNPSDHFPVMVKVSTEKIFPEAHGSQRPAPAPAPRPRVASGF